jgi:chaperonin GroEL
MAAKQFKVHANARQSILRGAGVLADAVRVTLGPKSKCVLIEKKFGRPIVCDDGVTIAKEVELKNPEENLGAQMVREAAERTGEAVGDGTTTSTLLARAILTEGVRNVAAGESAVDLKRGLTRGLKAAVECIRSLSRPVTNKREKAQVATISAHNNSIVGDTVAQPVEKVGKLSAGVRKSETVTLRNPVMPVTDGFSG